ncbi:hypothetical protein JY97_02470 [Alkalispirochaeta odontotermitis]|nr:hypothetical protein JY97_02470 [Alkalispirochaeta odontotermitis]CAB1079583.1 hypothetical protein D1AOALGA4SA_7291 [Olavius algarvensis Delta 1 endosymbiont]
MEIKCDKCNSIYNINSSKIPVKGAYVKCKKCQNRFFIQNKPEKVEKNTEGAKKAPGKNIHEQNQENEFSSGVKDIVCPKCSRRQPDIHDKCFNCGFDYKHSKSKSNGKFFSSNSIVDKFSELSPKKKVVASSGILSIGVVCLAGLYLLVSIGLPWLSGERRSIPVNEDSYTQTQYNQAFVAWLKKNLWQDYQDFGHQSPQWDSKVKKVLDKYAMYRLGYYDDELGYDIQSDLQNIINSGCNDPRLFYILGNVLFRNGGDIQRAEAIVSTSLSYLEQSAYPAFYKYFAANKLIRIYEKNGYDDNELLDPLYEKKMRYLALAAADERFGNGNQRFYFSILDYQFEYDWGSHSPRAIDNYMEEFDSLENVDPWIDCMIRGKYHISKGWQARGDGYANNVTEEGWEVFRKEISTAENYLTKAYGIHPEYPEAAALMIHIRMTSSGLLDEKDWFLRAVEAQFDYGKAYTIYQQALHPRWGGTHKAMINFGNACLETGRFDTRVPRYYLRTLKLISKDSPSGGGAWVKPFRKRGVYKKVRHYFESTLSDPREGLEYYKEYSAYAVYAWACGEYEDARQIKQDLGENFIPEMSDEELDIEPSNFLNHLSRT